MCFTWLQEDTLGSSFGWDTVLPVFYESVVASVMLSVPDTNTLDKLIRSAGSLLRGGSSPRSMIEDDVIKTLSVVNTSHPLYSVLVSQRSMFSRRLSAERHVSSLSMTIRKKMKMLLSKCVSLPLHGGWRQQIIMFPSFCLFVECQAILCEDPAVPCAVGASALQARSRISPTPPRPAPLLLLLEPRWPPRMPLASPCHSCCLSPLCCYHCCSPAPLPYVSIQPFVNWWLMTDDFQRPYAVPL